jgi:polar amino acid transport system substrate-binding protein
MTPRWGICFLLIAVSLFSTAPFTEIGAQETIRLATVQWEPYYGRDLKNQGYISEITRTVFERAGYEVKIRFMPWKRAIHDTKNGHYDGLMGLYHTEERAEWLAYSHSIAAIRIVFFAEKGKDISYSSLSDLKPYKIGIERGFAYTEEFDSADFLDKEPVRDGILNFKKLVNNRIDLVAASEKVFLHMVNSKGENAAENLQVIEPPLTTSRIYNGITRKKEGHEKIVADFNRALREIKQDGTFARILGKHGF